MTIMQIHMTNYANPSKPLCNGACHVQAIVPISLHVENSGSPKFLTGTSPGIMGLYNATHSINTIYDLFCFGNLAFKGVQKASFFAT